MKNSLVSNLIFILLSIALLKFNETAWLSGCEQSTCISLPPIREFPIIMVYDTKTDLFIADLA
jgi:hypothetical protein